MNKIKLRIATAVSFAAFGSAATPSSPDDPVARARAVLAAASRAYRTVPAMTDTLTYTVKAPNADLEPKKLEIRLGAGKDASVADPLLAAFAVGDTLYVTKSDSPGKFVRAPYNGDFARALNSVVGDQGSLFEPPQIAMRTGKGIDACIDSLRFKMLAPLRIDGLERRKDGARVFDIIHFTASNGSVDLRIDEATKYLAGIHLRLEPPGAPAGVGVDVDGRFSPKVLSRSTNVVAFDAGSGQAVASLSDLASASLPIGKPAPAFQLETSEGRPVSLASLKERVVIIDFWATWCAPCWKTLAETQKISDWAAKSGLPISVYALNTMEQFPSEQERRGRIAAFFKTQKLTFPTLLDRGDEVFKAFGSPGLPSMVIVSPDGSILRYHQGLFPDVAGTVAKEASDALNARAARASR